MSFKLHATLAIAAFVLSGPTFAGKPDGPSNEPYQQVVVGSFQFGPGRWFAKLDLVPEGRRLAIDTINISYPVGTYVGPVPACTLYVTSYAIPENYPSDLPAGAFGFEVHVPVAVEERSPGATAGVVNRVVGLHRVFLAVNEGQYLAVACEKAQAGNNYYEGGLLAVMGTLE
jgi:hypothetical protein